MLTDYTDYDTVRAVVGVSAEEVEDETLALPVYEMEVMFALDDLNSTLRTQYAAIKEIDPASSRSAIQTRLLNLVTVYSAYWVAKVLLNGSIELFAPKKITDGKATQQRIDDPFKTLRENVDASLAVWSVRIGATLSAIDPTQSVTTIPARTLMASTGLATDPVTGA